MVFARLAIASLVVAALVAPAEAGAQSPAPAGKKCASGDKVPVKLTTSAGPITLELDRKAAPITVDNFAKYVESGFYDGTVFHRVIDGFMIQGGGFTKDMRQKPTQAPIRNEAASSRLQNKAYTISMARTNNPDSATSQFFINVADNGMLDPDMPAKPGYAVFGKVTDGKDTVDKIKKVATGNAGMHQNVPKEAVTIEKAECL